MPVFDHIWGSWMGSTTTSTTTGGTPYTISNSAAPTYSITVPSTGTMWPYWVAQSVITNAYIPQATYTAVHHIEVTPEQQARHVQYRDRARAEARRRQEEMDAASDRALALMAVVLSAEQMASYESHQFFELRGSSGRLWRVRHGEVGNVRQVVNDVEVAALCAHPKMFDAAAGARGALSTYLPTEDCLVGQALHLMHDDEAFLATANVHWGDVRPASLGLAA